MLGKFYSNLHNTGGGIKYDLCNVYKSLLAALIIAIGALAIIPVRAFAEPIVLTDSNGITYTLTENADGETYTMTVSGSGDMEDYEYSTLNYRPYISYKDKITNIVIESGITHIGDNAFVACRSLTSVTIPEGVEVIGNNAFEACRSLTSVTFPSSLKSIGGNSFYQCYELRSVEIPEGVETIYEWAFWNCTSLTSVTLPSTVAAVEISAFNGCNSLDNIIYQDGLDVSSAGIPAASTQVKYTVSGGEVTITEIILGDGKTAVTIPDRIGGKTVAEMDKDLMQKVAHTHTGGTATCSQKAECALCGNEYGGFAAHNYADGVCAVCNAADPDYTPPTETVPTETSPADTTTETEPTGTSPTGTEPTGTSPTGTAPSIPSRPSAPSYPSSPAVTAVTETTAVTAAAEEEIISPDDTDEDVSAGAGIYGDDSNIPEKSAGVIVFAMAAVVIAAVIIKKMIF